MRIVQVSHGFPPEQVGGAEWYTAHLANTLRARGHEVLVFTRRADWRHPEYEVREERVDGLRVFRINNTWRACPSFEESYHHGAIAKRFGELLEALQPDLVHIQHVVGLSTHIPDEAHQRQIPVAMTFHDYWLLCNQGQLLQTDGSLCLHASTGACVDCAGLWLGMGTPARRVLRVLERWRPDIRYRTSPLRQWAHRYLRMTHQRPAQQSMMATRMQRRRQEMLRLATSVDVGIVPSQTVWDQLVRSGIPAERCILLPHGIPTKGLVRPTEACPGTLRVTYCGQMIPAKGIHVLLEAAQQLHRTDVEVHLYGDVPPYGDISEYATRMQRQAARLPYVHWHGQYAHDALSRIFSKTDVVVVPSIWSENQPLVILEAFAARIPVIATNLGGMAELVRDGENGLLFPRGDTQALAGCLARLADDRPLLERLRHGIEPIKDIETHAKELEEVYASLLGCQVRHTRVVA